jgi:hypothetical protein
MIESISDSLSHFNGSFFPVADRNKYLKGKIFVCGEDDRVDFEEIDTNSHEFLNSVMFDKKLSVPIKL